MATRQIKNMATGEIMEVPDGTPDEIVLAPFREANPRQGFGIAEQLAQAAMPLLQQTQNQPVSTLPNISAKSTLGLTPDQLMQTAGMIQQSNQSMVQQKIQARVEAERQMEAEKDRQQQLKLQQLQFKNQQMQQKHEEDLYEARLKVAEKAAEAKANQPKSGDYQLLQQEDGTYARVDKITGDVMPLPLKGRMPQVKAAGGGGAGAPKASDFDKITLDDGRIVYFNPMTKQQIDTGLKAKATGPKSDAPTRADLVDAYLKLSEDGDPMQVPEIMRLKYPGAETEAVIAEMEKLNGDTTVVPKDAPGPSWIPSGISNLFGSSPAPVVPTTPQGQPAVAPSAPTAYQGKAVTAAQRAGNMWKLELEDGTTVVVKETG